MSIGIRAILDFFRDSTGRIMIILGTFFVFIALLLQTRVYQYVSSLIWLLGVTLIIIGAALHFEAFQWKIPSIKGFGTILMYVSPLFMAAAVVAAIFAVPEDLLILPGDPFHPNSSTRFVVMLLERPYVWLATPLMLTGLGLLAFGLLLKFAGDIF